MCGIAGFVALHSDAFRGAAELVERQLRLITRRGPDSDGMWLDPTSGVAFGHRRLAIVDLSSAGHQPMSSPSGRFVISYNGEIYNHHELRSLLEGEGRAPTWLGHSDTETLVAAFEAWGVEQTLQRCVGMFAFALFDRRDRLVHLARDRFGEKPLYYGFVGTGAERRFAFGSELSTVSSLPGFEKQLDPDALGGLLQFGYIGSPSTIYRGAHHLPPASLMTLDPVKGSVTTRSFWDPVATAMASRARAFEGSDEEATDALESVLGRAIQMQMVADVPLGAFLSGGIDSTSVVALMTQYATSKVKTFTIGFHDKAHDEAPYAKRVANHLGTDHVEHYLTDREALELIPQLPLVYSEPFGDSSQLPTLLVAKLARKHVTVSLSGDAGDELFAGYNRYMFADRAWGKLRRIPIPLRKALVGAVGGVSQATLERVGCVYNVFAGRHAVNNFADKAAKALRVMDSNDVGDFYQAAVAYWQPSPICGREHVHAAASIELQSGLGPIESMMLRDTVNYLPGDILQKVDRACMGVSLEGRVPFLDHRVFEFAWSLPMRLKIRDGKSKWLLRRLLERRLPPQLMDRPKMGFAMPLAGWLRGELRPWAEELLSAAALQDIPELDVHRVRAAWSSHCAGERNMTEQLWPLLSLQAWRLQA
ncbi:asparagine synthase (glutamine-hydrolyzing) [Roseateles sp.]|uniref:asparagine synthase (glutamine-hydrolyzing) n=1 Tax=Roseateles sp. TaxID=1971397 RepID=UPI002E0AF726|nr:asparagine synthase (glutamine-hydrolyzing) [Roseateles sp.]